MPGLPFPVVVHAAAGHNGHVGVFAYVEIVVDQIVYITVGHTGGNIDVLPLGARPDADIDAGLIGFRDDFNIFSGLPSGAIAVLPDIKGSLQLFVGTGNKR